MLTGEQEIVPLPIQTPKASWLTSLDHQSPENEKVQKNQLYTPHVFHNILPTTIYGTIILLIFTIPNTDRG